MLKVSYHSFKNCSHYSIASLLGSRVTRPDLRWPVKKGMCRKKAFTICKEKQRHHTAPFLTIF